MPFSQVRKCAHPGCQCLVSETTEYCSDYCKLTGEDEYCGCAHTSCNTRFAQSAQPQQAASGFFYGSAQPAPADLSKKLDELTAQVQALTKAVEGLKASQSQGGEKK